MPARRASFPLPALLLCLLLLLPACDDDSTGPGGDRRPPRVVATTPTDGAIQVAPDAPVRIPFDEPLDRESLAGNVSLEGATLTGAGLVEDGRTLVVQHEDFAAGREVTVRLGAGLRDLAGNELGAARSFRFWTATEELLLLAQRPLDEAAGVAPNEPVRLLFSLPMDLVSLADAITLETFEPFRAAVDFTLEDAREGWVWVRCTPPEGSAALRLWISTEARSLGGTPLAEAVDFSWRLDPQQDTTPPRLLAVEPADGRRIPPDTPFLRFTFDEPVDRRSALFQRLSGNFLLATADAPRLHWREDDTVLILPLTTPLPAGAPLHLVLRNLMDRAGNQAPEPVDYRVVVQGDADYYPLVDGRRFYFGAQLTPGEAPAGKRTGPVGRYEGLRRQSEGLWHRIVYEDSDYQTIRSWIVLGIQPGGITRQATHGVEGFAADYDLDPDVEWLRLPPSEQSWSGTSQVLGHEETVVYDYEIAWVRREDVPYFPEDANILPFDRTTPAVPFLQPELLWEDCWMQTVESTYRVDGELSETARDTFWYAPAVGRVRHRGRTDFPVAGTWLRTEQYLREIDPSWTFPSPD